MPKDDYGTDFHAHEDIVASTKARKLVGQNFINFLQEQAESGLEMPGIGRFHTPEFILAPKEDVFALSRAFEAIGTRTGSETYNVINNINDNLDGGAFVVQFDHDTGENQRGGVFHLEIASKEQFFSLATREKPLINTQTFPGAIDDLEKYVLLHETVEQNVPVGANASNLSIDSNLWADQGAYVLYYKAYEQGLVSDPELPYAYRSMRAMNVVFNGHETFEKEYYLTSLAALPGEEPIVTAENTNLAQNTLDDVRLRIAEEVGTDLLPEADNVIKLRAVLLTDGSILENGTTFELSEQDLAAATQLAYGGEADPEKASKLLEQLEQQIPAELKQAYQDYIETSLKYERLDVGIDSYTENPKGAYIKAKELLENGAYEGDEIAEKFLETFIDGVERYGSEKFGLPEYEHGPPESVVRLQERAAARPIEKSPSPNTDQPRPPEAQPRPVP